ncbi:MAG: hypothetical protein M3R15_04725 [Acidobacteriota bacterium]|nr:hypothetical protein [Acidobacteriota bacterium]
MLGAFRRIVKQPQARHAFLMGFGMAVLANSRPYEGMVLSLLTMATLLAWMVGRGSLPMRVSLRRIMLPVSIVLALTALGMGFYNWRVTGDTLRMPYMVHEETYAVAPVFLWRQTSPEPAYRHKEIRDLHIGWSLPIYTAQRSAASFLRQSVNRILFLAQSYFTPIVLLARVRYQQVALAILLATMLWVLRKDRWGRLALLFSILFTIALLPETWMLSHYTAPAAGLFFVLGLQTARHLRWWRWRKIPVGQFAVWAILVLFTVSLVSFYVDLSRADGETPWEFQRARILAHLKQDEGRHLVIVRYGPNHSPHHEWVYNDAHIDGAKVVWAREMDATQNRKLLGYFKDRRVWLLEADAEPPKLVPYSVEIDHTEDSVRVLLDIKTASLMNYK